MATTKTKDDLRALSRSLGMVDAAAADMAAHADTPKTRAVHDRVAASRLRELGTPEDEIVANLGYSPAPFELDPTRTSAPTGDDAS